MKIEGLSTRALRFMGANDGLAIFSDSGVRIQIVEVDNWLRVMIAPGDDTTHKQIREAIPLALEWRDRLLQWQGHWTKGGDQGMYERLHFLHRDMRRSYATLADQLNHSVADHLVEHVKWYEEYTIAKDSLRTMGEFLLYKWQHNQFSYDHAKGILTAMRLSESEVDELLAVGIRRIQNGEEPFEEGYPISRDQVIHVLRVWRRKRSVPDDDDTVD